MSESTEILDAENRVLRHENEMLWELVTQWLQRAQADRLRATLDLNAVEREAQVVGLRKGQEAS